MNNETRFVVDGDSLTLWSGEDYVTIMLSVEQRQMVREAFSNSNKRELLSALKACVAWMERDLRYCGLGDNFTLQMAKRAIVNGERG